MDSYLLNIAGYIIKVEKAPEVPSLWPSKRFKNFLCDNSVPDITIRLRTEKFIPEGAIDRVFHAPYFEEELNKPVKKADEFWSVYTEKENLLINIKYPAGKPAEESWLRFSLSRSTVGSLYHHRRRDYRSIVISPRWLDSLLSHCNKRRHFHPWFRG